MYKNKTCLHTKNSKLCQSKEELLTCKIVTRWPSHWQLSVTCLSMLCSAALKLTAPTGKCERMWTPEFHWISLTSRTGNHKNWREFYWTNKTKSRSKLVISGEKALNAPRSCWACPPDRWLYILDPNPDIIDSRGWFLKHRLGWRQKNIPWMSTGRGGNVTIFNCLLLMPLQLINE